MPCKAPSRANPPPRRCWPSSTSADWTRAAKYARGRRRHGPAGGQRRRVPRRAVRQPWTASLVAPARGRAAAGPTSASRPGSVSCGSRPWSRAASIPQRCVQIPLRAPTATPGGACPPHGRATSGYSMIVRVSPAQGRLAGSCRSRVRGARRPGEHGLPRPCRPRHAGPRSGRRRTTPPCPASWRTPDCSGSVRTWCSRPRSGRLLPGDARARPAAVVLLAGGLGAAAAAPRPGSACAAG